MRIRVLDPQERLRPRQFLLHAARDVKAIAYDASPGALPATTGTSQKDVVCLTDGMGPCIGVAIGGEVPKGREVGAANAKVRVFYIFPDNQQVTTSLRDYVQRLQASGLSVRAALHGGEAHVAQSREKAREIRTLLRSLDVHVDFDESCELRDGRDTLIGAVASHDGSVQLVTELVHRP